MKKPCDHPILYLLLCSLNTIGLFYFYSTQTPTPSCWLDKLHCCIIWSPFNNKPVLRFFHSPGLIVDRLLEWTGPLQPSIAFFCIQLSVCEWVKLLASHCPTYCTSSFLAVGPFRTWAKVNSQWMALHKLISKWHQAVKKKHSGYRRGRWGGWERWGGFLWSLNDNAFCDP